MDDATIRWARTATRLALIGAWTATTAAALHTCLTGSPGLFTGFVGVPALVLASAGAAHGADVLTGRLLARWRRRQLRAPVRSAAPRERRPAVPFGGLVATAERPHYPGALAG